MKATMDYYEQFATNVRLFLTEQARVYRALTMLLFIIVAGECSAQILRADELEEYSKERYGEKWVDAAEKIGSETSLDKNNGITYVQIIEAPEKSADDLYVLLNYWFTSTFNDANSVIQLNDKEVGTIIGQGYVQGIAEHTGGMNRYSVSIRPVIKCDIKEGRVRVTYTVPYYCVNKVVGGGWIGAGSATDRSLDAVEENWLIDETYPFNPKDKKKKTASKALVMTHAYSFVVLDKIEECIVNGLIGNEDDNW